jgi:hypothetical protein
MMADALHEAGHAVVYEALGSTVERVTLGYVEAVPAAVPAAVLAGFTAAQHAGYDSRLSAADLALLDAALRARGQSRAYLGGYKARAAELVAAYWPAIVAVASALVRRRELDGATVRHIARAAMAHAARPLYRSATIRPGRRVA